MARAQTNHATAGRPSPFVATRAARVEIWMRTTGRRRQAFYRCKLAGVTTWQAMGVPLALKALKAGSIDLPGLADAAVESYEEEEAPAHPMAADFAERARALNSDIDALNLSARGDA